ncbi:hypothetical protein LTR85_000172 [Meristemomyces frigidus]|nr:hypothetical protein LTR85_000172 [Meristemomyces frigidus]
MSVLFRNNRLGVGLREKDCTIVWYEPIIGEDGKEEEDGTADIALFRFDTGEPGYREPMEGEIAWFPWYDPDRFPSKKKAERLRLQKQFLSDAHKYCNAKDAAAVRRLEIELHYPEYRRWDAWFAEARKWKRPKMKQRVNRRKAREMTATAAGVDDADINSDTSEDSAYESESEVRARVSKKRGNMAPPPRPSGAGGKRKAKDSGPKGKKQAPKRPKPNTSNRSSLASNHQSPSPLFMSGGLGSRRASLGRHSTISGSSLDQDEEGNISDDYEIRHPTVPPEEHPEQLHTPRATHPHRAKSRSAPHDGIPPFKEWADRNGAAEHGDQGERERNGSPSGLLPRLDGDGEDADRMRDEINAGMDDDQAFRAAMRASQVPEDAKDEQLNGEEGRADGVRASIEDDDKEEGEGEE